MGANASWVTDEQIVRHSPWMKAILRAMLPDCEVEDALQDAWLKVLRSSTGYRGDGIKSYLGKVTRSVAVDRLRKNSPTLSLDLMAEEDETGEAEPVDPSPTPSEHLECTATHEDVLAAVRQLPSGQRQVLLMRLEAEMPFREIAAEMNIPLGTALTWMHQATRRLKHILTDRKEN